MSATATEPARTETKTAAEPMESMGAIFDRAMEKSPKETVKQTAIAKVEPEPEKKDELKVKETVAPAKSAVDSLLDTTTKAEPGADIDPLSEFKDDKTSNVKRMREVIGETHAKLKESQKEIGRLSELAKKAETSGEIQTQLEAIQKERDEMRAYVRAVDIQQDPDFRAKYIDGRAALIEKAVKRVSDAGGTGDTLREALGLTGKKRAEAIREAMSDMDDFDRRKVETLLDQVDDLDDARAEALKTPDTTWETIQKSRQSQTLAERQKSEAAIFSEIAAVADELPASFFMLRKADPSAPDAEAWNADVTKANDAVKYLMGSNAPARDVAATLLKGLRAEPLQALYIAERKARIEAETELQKFRSSSPGISGKAAPEAKEKKNWERPPGEVFREAMADTGAD